MVQLSHPYMTTRKTITLTIHNFVGKVMSLLLNMLSRLVITLQDKKIFYVGALQMELVVKNLPANARDKKDMGLIPGSGRSPGGGHGNPLQYSCLENPMNRGAWWAIVHRVAHSQT